MLQKLNIELPYNQREHLFARFHEISRAFQSNRDGRNNMLPYLFVLNKIFGELNLSLNSNANPAYPTPSSPSMRPDGGRLVEEALE